MTGNFLGEPPLTPEAQALYDEDLAEDGYVSSGARLWAYQPEAVRELFALMSRAYRASGLTFRQCAILVTATASTLGDSACSMAWGGKRLTARQGVHLPTEKVGCHRANGQVRTEMRYWTQLWIPATVPGVPGRWGDAVL